MDVPGWTFRTNEPGSDASASRTAPGSGKHLVSNPHWGEVDFIQKTWGLTGHILSIKTISEINKVMRIGINF